MMGTGAARQARGAINGNPWFIHFTEHGDGEAVILLHGGGPGANGASNYSRNIAALSEHFHVYVLDFPGWGKSSKNLEKFGGIDPFDNGGRAIAAFMDSLEIGKAHLVGNSFGASAALKLAMSAPERVNRMVLNGPGGGKVPNENGPTEGILQLLTYYSGSGPSLEKLQAFLHNLVYDVSAVSPELLKERLEASLDPEIVANPPLRLPVGGGPPPPSLIIAEDVRIELIKNPTLIIWGLEDRTNLAAGAFSFRPIENCDFLFLAKCGHWAQWERPHDFNEATIKFLRKN